MKEKIKNTLFIGSILYSLLVIGLMLFNSFNIVSKVELKDSKDNKKKLAEYKEEISKLSDNDCTKAINSIIKHYEETTYNGEVQLSEMLEYDYDNSILSYYKGAIDNCGISEEKSKEYNLPTKFITASIQRDEIYGKYYFQYELNFKDILTRSIVEPEMNDIEYEINRNTELEIIGILIKEAISNE